MLSGGGAVASSALSGFFTNFWKLADVSDAIGSLTLTNSATPVTFVAGKIGNCGAFVSASSEALTNASVSFTGPSYTVALWFNSSVQAAFGYMFNWGAVDGVASIGVLLGYPAAGNVTLECNNVDGKKVVSAVNYLDSNWHLVIAYFDNSSGNGTLVIDNGAPVSVAGNTGIASATRGLALGRLSAGANFFNGKLDAVGFADNKIPTPSQITAMWNGGAGVEPPF